MYLLDTCICVEMIRGRNENILMRLGACVFDEVGVSSITLAELETGVEKNARREQARAALDNFLTPFPVYPFDDVAAGHYGIVRAELERQGRVIGALETLIAAHALALGAVVVTNNEREFRRVTGLAVENWVYRGA